jgi:hypothetical protein
MAKLATLFIGAVTGGILGVVGIFAMMGAVSPSADHVANETAAVSSAEDAYGNR